MNIVAPDRLCLGDCRLGRMVIIDVVAIIVIIIAVRVRKNRMKTTASVRLKLDVHSMILLLRNVLEEKI